MLIKGASRLSSLDHVPTPFSISLLQVAIQVEAEKYHWKHHLIRRTSKFLPLNVGAWNRGASHYTLFRLIRNDYDLVAVPASDYI